jgi:hypothetical protein
MIVRPPGWTVPDGAPPSAAQMAPLNWHIESNTHAHQGSNHFVLQVISE